MLSRVVVVILMMAVPAVLIAPDPSAAHAEAAPIAHTHDLTIDGAPLDGRPIDFVAVGDAYLGLVARDGRFVVVTSRNGDAWKVTEPLGLDAPYWDGLGAYPGGLNKVAHVLFTDGKVVYFRAQSDVEYNRLGITTLYMSDASGRVWHRVALPVPDGRGAFPITALRSHGRSFLGGAVYGPVSGQSFLDAAVWTLADDASWKLVDTPAFAGDGNQTIFTLVTTDDGIVAGGGDGSLIPTERCCFYPDGIAFWHGGKAGRRWLRAEVTQPAYKPRFDTAAAVGVVGGDRVLEGVIAGTRSARSHDSGRTWSVKRALVPTAAKAVYAPRADAVVALDDLQVGVTAPTDDCSDCTRGALAVSDDDGRSWKNVTPKFPCGQGIGRDNYGFVSRPEDVGSSVAVLAACGPALSAFNETLLGTSRDGGRHWRIERLNPPVGAPIPAVARRGRIVTLVATTVHDMPGRVRAVTVGS